MRFLSYGLDAPKIIGYLFVGGLLCATLSVGIYLQWPPVLLIMKGWFLFDSFKIFYPFYFLIKRDTANFWRRSFLKICQGGFALVMFVGLYQQQIYAYLVAQVLLIGFSVAFLVPALLMIWSSLVGKRLLRDRLLNLMSWQGNEKVLDVGCGRGLMLIGAARKLTSGKAVGVDVWQKGDLSSNSRSAVVANIEKAGLAHKAEVVDGDARSLPFTDSFFDVVLSNFVLHNIPTEVEREQALREVVRVLKPGGTVLINDFQYTDQYAAVLKKLGLKEVRRSRLQWLVFPPARWVIGRK